MMPPPEILHTGPFEIIGFHVFFDEKKLKEGKINYRSNNYNIKYNNNDSNLSII